MTRKLEMSLNSSAVTDIHLQSSGQLSLNFTESLIEVFPKMLHFFYVYVWSFLAS